MPRNTHQPLAAPSAFLNDDTTLTHFMPGDNSKIFNPKTGKYVKVEGKIGQAVIDEFGYPAQHGGYSLTDLNNQLSQSFTNLYNSLTSAWTDLNKPDPKPIAKTSGKVKTDRKIQPKAKIAKVEGKTKPKPKPYTKA